ncbi:hypothetical protein Q3G72_023681 [Acer saccharum]|nr:hypothetical protein Q3G72_023681 [Acer saccharum]
MPLKEAGADGGGGGVVRRRETVSVSVLEICQKTKLTSFFDSESDSGHHEGVTVAGPPTKSTVGDVGVHLQKIMVVGRLVMLGELNMEPPSTSEVEAGRFLFDNPVSKLLHVDVKKLKFKLGIPSSVNVRAAVPFEQED